MFNWEVFRMKKTRAFLLGILILLVSMLLSFGITAGILAILCWCFSITFNIKLVLGTWIIWTLVSNLIKSKKKE